jgi:DNA ligase (NAD+)
MKATEFLGKLKNIDITKLSEIKGLGEVLIQNFEDFLSSDRFGKLNQRFTDLEDRGIGLKINNIQSVDISSLPLFGQVFCITGTFDKPRNEIKKMLEKQGAKVVDAITKETTILLAGQNSGSKLAKAEKSGIKIETEYSVYSL